MAVNEKVSKALKTAANYLEKSISAFNQKDEASFSDGLWHVAAELEYALFIFSITFQNENVSSWKPNLEKTNINPALEDVRTLLSEAERFVIDGRLLESYKNVYVARNYIRKVQEVLAKKVCEKPKRQK
ncbi:MAG: hypothetical protein QW270_01305 [Candidatus Bathyarchaeia archaeon]